MIKSAASLPLPPLLTQLPLTHHTTSDVLEICPLSSYRKTSLHRSCLITVCELQPIASYQYQLPIASCLSSCYTSNHRVSMSVKPSSYFSHNFHTSPCPSICSYIPSVLFSFTYSKRFPSSSTCHLTCVHLAPASYSQHALSS